jgi:hypothetical protein
MLPFNEMLFRQRWYNHKTAAVWYAAQPTQPGVPTATTKPILNFSAKALHILHYYPLVKTSVNS